nr:hypothetical protein [Paenibacillus xylanexedens]
MQLKRLKEKERTWAYGERLGSNSHGAFSLVNDQYFTTLVPVVEPLKVLLCTGMAGGNQWYAI